MRQRPCTGLSEGVSAEQMGRCDGLWRPPQQAQVGAGSDAVLPSRGGAARPRVCAASRAAPTGAGRGPPPLAPGAACPLASVCGETSRAAGALYGMRAEGPSERVGSAWFLCPQFSASLSAPRRLVGSREEPCSFLRGISRKGGSRGPEALHGDRPRRAAAPATPKAGADGLLDRVRRQWAGEPPRGVHLRRMLQPGGRTTAHHLPPRLLHA